MNLEQLKSKLEDSKERIEKEILEQKSPISSDVDSLKKKTVNRAVWQSIGGGAGLKKQLADIETALRKIEKGTYGKCEKCGNAISDDVLEIIPDQN